MYDNHHSTNSIQIYEMVSPFQAIRGALGNINMGHLFQNLQDDLLRWTGEANELIIQDTRACTIYEPCREVKFTKNSRVKLCSGFSALECLKLNGAKIDFEYKRSRCTTTCGNGDSCSTCCSDIAPSIPTPGCGGLCVKFSLDGCWVKFSETVADDLEVDIEGWRIPLDDNGYSLMIGGPPVTAATQYVAWQACLSQGDNRATTFERIWYNRVRQARAFINKKSDAELKEIGKYWFPRHFILGGCRPYYNY